MLLGWVGSIRLSKSLEMSLWRFIFVFLFVWSISVWRIARYIFRFGGFPGF